MVRGSIIRMKPLLSDLYISQKLFVHDHTSMHHLLHSSWDQVRANYRTISKRDQSTLNGRLTSFLQTLGANQSETLMILGRRDCLHKYRSPWTDDIGYWSHSYTLEHDLQKALQTLMSDISCWYHCEIPLCQIMRGKFRCHNLSQL
jgi:hypothetical protein